MTTMNVAVNPLYLAMPDAVNVNLLPVGYPAYLGYVDGNFQTAAVLRGMFPDAELVLLTVTARPYIGQPESHGVRVSPGTDVEPGDALAIMGVAWAQHALSVDPASRPVIYASVVGEPGYGMPDVLHNLAHDGIDRSRVRLLSAHYGLGPHVCGPATCRAISVDMDGTQWTDSYPVPGGVVDMSILKPGFFGAPAPAPTTETERLVRELGIVRQGDRGEAVKTVQALCHARLPGSSPMIDGIFGQYTANAVMNVQHAAGLTQDGVVGPLTWPVLLGVA